MTDKQNEQPIDEEATTRPSGLRDLLALLDEMIDEFDAAAEALDADVRSSRAERVRSRRRA